MPENAGCAGCGLLDRADPKGSRCVRLGIVVRDSRDRSRGRESGREAPGGTEECPFFYPLTYDGSEPYSPEEHLRLQEDEFRRRAMRGPV